METNTTVIDETGQTGRLIGEVPTDGHEGTVTIALDERRQVVVPTERLSFDNGDVRLDGAFDEFDVLESQPEAQGEGDDESLRVPLAREEVTVRRRRRPIGRVQIDKRVEEEEVSIDEQLDFDEVDIERVPVDRVVDEAPSVRSEGDTLVIPVLEERLVKQTVLVEEIRVTKHRRSEEVSEPVTLRHEKVDIRRDRLDSDSDSDAPRPSR